MKFTLVLCIFLYALTASADIWMDDFERREIGENWIPSVIGGGDAKWEITKGVLQGSRSDQILYRK